MTQWTLYCRHAAMAPSAIEESGIVFDHDVDFTEHLLKANKTVEISRLSLPPAFSAESTISDVIYGAVKIQVHPTYLAEKKDITPIGSSGPVVLVSQPEALTHMESPNIRRLTNLSVADVLAKAGAFTDWLEKLISGGYIPLRSVHYQGHRTEPIVTNSPKYYRAYDDSNRRLAPIFLGFNAAQLCFTGRSASDRKLCVVDADANNQLHPYNALPITVHSAAGVSIPIIRKYAQGHSRLVDPSDKPQFLLFEYCKAMARISPMTHQLQEELSDMHRPPEISYKDFDALLLDINNCKPSTFINISNRIRATTNFIIVNTTNDLHTTHFVNEPGVAHDLLVLLVGICCINFVYSRRYLPRFEKTCNHDPMGLLYIYRTALIEYHCFHDGKCDLVDVLSIGKGLSTPQFVGSIIDNHLLRNDRTMAYVWANNYGRESWPAHMSTAAYGCFDEIISTLRQKFK